MANGVVFINNRNGTFSEGQAVAASGEAFADVNGDGKMDVISVTSGAFMTHLGNGDGSFKLGISSPSSGLSLSSFFHNVSFGDINADGITDVAYGTNVALGLGNGRFSAQASVVPNGSGISNSQLLDVNQDGYDDLTIMAGSSLNIFLSRGNGSFEARTTFTMGELNFYLSAADVNGDGIDDLALGGVSKISIMSFSESGTPSLLSERSGTGQIFAADFNRDGAIDIGSVDFGTDQSLLYLGATTQVSSQAYLDLLSQSSARSSLNTLDATQNRITLERGKLGSFQSRLAVASSTLKTGAEEFAASASRISATDIAAEAAVLTASKIRQQVGASVLAQANQIPALALVLLR